MNKEIKNFDKIVGIALIVLTFISLIIDALEFTNMIYNNSYITDNLNSLLVSTPFNILLWIDNFLIYLLGLLYIIDTIKYKKDILIRTSLAVFSILTTIVMEITIINAIASLFGIF